ncbi:hypothetical protein SERLA73DRAFT_73812 [Serpula lacrymans var. lacrymans S7.3]|uniref:Uncharacterized protein n=2 Tax=Serpula lacrymans var. lacrymans TaxID=341189 RepID=F8PWV3_SERL3|nr:uncharacterized protein SERLADRAFT_438444 [Serpula lacrymans var. lacrymans S7.9]EGN99280.1 hypothetical protein SERLA73DRAFT_73812 [Serpula lacrymans var. lacrymans S7.3]EGO24845.1 hypothetical protein SERLADRAFT_438444 [Serpula lacrymans var. lacrymans S7.9]
MPYPHPSWNWGLGGLVRTGRVTRSLIQRRSDSITHTHTARLRGPLWARTSHLCVARVTAPGSLSLGTGGGETGNGKTGNGKRGNETGNGKWEKRETHPAATRRQGLSEFSPSFQKPPQHPNVEILDLMRLRDRRLSTENGARKKPLKLGEGTKSEGEGLKGRRSKTGIDLVAKVMPSLNPATEGVLLQGTRTYAAFASPSTIALPGFIQPLWTRPSGSR